MNITQKCARAFAAWLQSKTFTDIPKDQIYRGIENPSSAEGNPDANVRKLPCVVCRCQSANQFPKFSGNWNVIAEVMVSSSAADSTEDQHHDRADEVFETLLTDTIKDDISSALDGFTAFLVVPLDQGYRLNDRTWESWMSFEVHCCPSDILE